MPPKKGKKTPKKKVVRKRATAILRDMGMGLQDLRGQAMFRNMPIPGSSQFTPFIGYQDQAISVIRANANNTVARAEKEINQKLVEQNKPLFEAQEDLYQALYDEFGASAKLKEAIMGLRKLKEGKEVKQPSVIARRQGQTQTEMPEVATVEVGPERGPISAGELRTLESKKKFAQASKAKTALERGFLLNVEEPIFFQ